MHRQYRSPSGSPPAPTHVQTMNDYLPLLLSTAVTLDVEEISIVFVI